MNCRRRRSNIGCRSHAAIALAASLIAIVAPARADVAPAAAACTVVTGPTLARQSGRLATLDGTHLQLASADGRQGVDVPLADVVWIDFGQSPASAATPNPLAPASGQPSVGAVPRATRRRPSNPAAPDRGGAAAADVARAATSLGDFLLVLRDGERLRGTPASIGNDTLVFQTRSLGQRSIGVAQIAGLARVPGTPAAADPESLAAAIASPTTQPAADAAAAQDELRLANGDIVRGVVASADGRAVTVQAADGQSVPIEWANVRQVRLAQLPGTEATATNAASASFIVRTVGGDLIRCASLSIAGDGKLTLTASDAANSAAGSIPLPELRSIDHLDGTVRSLSNLPPASRSYEPYFPPAAGASAIRETAAPPTITVGGKTTRSFLLSRPHSRLTWQLDAISSGSGGGGGGVGPQHFSTRFGVPDGRPYANATVRVLVDDKPVAEQANVTAGVLSDPPLDVPIAAGAHTLTLEVDYGDAFDVQDDVVWFEPVFVMGK